MHYFVQHKRSSYSSDTTYGVTENESKAMDCMSADSEGYECEVFCADTIEEGVNSLRRKHDTTVPSGLTHVGFQDQGHFYEDNFHWEQQVTVGTDLWLTNTEVPINELANFLSDNKIIYAKCVEDDWEDAGIYVVHEDQGKYRLELSKSKINRRKKSPEYARNSRYRRGHIPIHLMRGPIDCAFWFVRNTGVPFEYPSGTARADQCANIIEKMVNGFKELLIIDQLRNDMKWATNFVELSHYCVGIETPGTLGNKDWPQLGPIIREECTAMDIPIPTYSKRKTK